MGFLPQKRSKRRLIRGLFFLIALAFLLLFPGGGAFSDILAYDPEVDISLGTFSYLMGEEQNAPSIKTGPYLGGYLSMKSPIFTYFFNSENVYNIFEAGFSVNEIEEQSSTYYLVNIPISVDFAYRIPVLPKFSILPFVGVGLGLSFNSGGGNTGPPIYTFIKTGVEIRYLMWKDTHLKVKVDYGIAFVNETETGFVPFLRVRFPIPFIP